ncbi:DNA polymerase alpha/primase associated subunit [Viridothelium virens]|uniref:DNA polymerase alpha subunit B n=1 Tax=Viridothelium virens TaxID=1048519 RepID=A0A6A6H5Y8_VIRVR|nr:DNA polymerase alpha/primase associated subunit [Viridothelium virens]
MADLETELNELFSMPDGRLSTEILGEMQSIMRLHSISPQELMYKWESYSIKMGAETTQLDLKTIRDFKKDLQDILERESRGKTHVASANKKTGATPRAGIGSGGDVFGMLDGLVPSTPRPGAVNGSAIKRKSNFETPAVKSNKQHANSSPSGFETPHTNGDSTTPVTTSIITDGAGQIQETINAHLDAPEDAPPKLSEPRIKIKSNTEMQKFAYKSMAMKLSDASETLDDRIDDFVSILQAHYSLPESSFGNPTAPSTSEIVAVGRIASDATEGKLHPANLVLETSRRTGAGRRIPLQIDDHSNYDFFPGQIVALKGMNANGDAFRISEIISIPSLPEAATLPSDIDLINARLGSSASAEDSDEPSESPHPTTILVASGPYTPSPTLDFTALHALLTRAATLQADALLLLGPFLPFSHPAVRHGEFDLPSSAPIAPDQATLVDVFRHYISAPLHRLVQQHPHIHIILVPSTDDAIAKHVSWPQDRLQKKELGLARQVSCVTNPVTLTLNDVAIGMSSQDVLSEIRAQNCTGGKAKMERDVLGRMAGLVVQQRHFFPVFPPAKRAPLPREEGEGEDGDEERLRTGASLDVGFLKLGEFVGVRPDVLVLPSVLNPFAKVVQGTTVINPGTLSKRRAPGTYARMTVHARNVIVEERERGELLGNRVYERCRVDIVKIGGS